MTELALIERVARAICQEEGYETLDSPLEYTGESGREHWLGVARVAIEETLRPPRAPEAEPNFFDRKAAVLQKPSRPPIADSFFDGEIEFPEDKDKGWR